MHRFVHYYATPILINESFQIREFLTWPLNMAAPAEERATLSALFCVIYTCKVTAKSKHMTLIDAAKTTLMDVFGSEHLKTCETDKIMGAVTATPMEPHSSQWWEVDNCLFNKPFSLMFNTTIGGTRFIKFLCQPNTGSPSTSSSSTSASSAQKNAFDVLMCSAQASKSKPMAVLPLVYVVNVDWTEYFACPWRKKIFGKIFFFLPSVPKFWEHVTGNKLFCLALFLYSKNHAIDLHVA